MGQVTKDTLHHILAYAEQGKHFPLTVNEVQQLARLAAQQLASPTKVGGYAPTDDVIERFALEYIAPHAKTFAPDKDYKQTEQFRRVKAYTLALLGSHAAKVGGDEGEAFNSKIEDLRFLEAWPEISKAGYDYGWLGIGLAAWRAALSAGDSPATATNANLLEALEEIVKNDPFNQSSAGVIARAALTSPAKDAQRKPMTDRQIIELCTSVGVEWEGPDMCDFMGDFGRVNMAEMRAIIDAAKEKK